VRLGRVDNLIAKPVERLIEGLLRHREVAFARACEEIADERVEPDVVVAVGAPQSEGAARALAAKLAVNRLVDSSVEIGVDAEMFDRGGIAIETVCSEQP
jgi:hypothetical protein